MEYNPRCILKPSSLWKLEQHIAATHHVAVLRSAPFPLQPADNSSAILQAAAMVLRQPVKRAFGINSVVWLSPERAEGTIVAPHFAMSQPCGVHSNSTGSHEQQGFSS